MIPFLLMLVIVAGALLATIKVRHPAGARCTCAGCIAHRNHERI